MLPLLFTALITAAPAPTNTVCPVMGGAVGPKSQVVEVKGKAYRICCGGCKAKLQKNPERYLDAQGNVKTTPKR